MKQYFFLFTVIVFVVLGCTSTNNEQGCTADECLKQEAYDRVIAVHDEVMPKLAYISELKGQLEARMNATDDSLVIANWQNLMENLDLADEAMWLWMRQFNSDLEEVNLDDALTYLKSEEEKIAAVARTINEAIANAEEELK